MAHHIYGNDNMLAVGQAPWHGLGVTMATPPASAAEALQIAGLNWEVKKEPLYTGDGTRVVIAGPANTKKNGEYGVIRRQDNQDMLGVVGPGYVPLQNADMGELFQPLIADGSVSIETCGSLFNGRRVWMLARFGQNEVIEAGDEIAKYLLLAHGHDGTFAVRFGFTPIRVVCYNTLSAASQSEESRLMRCLHTSGLADNLTVLRNAMQLGEQVFSLTAEQYRKLQRTGCNHSDLREYARIVIEAAEDSKEWTAADAKKIAAIVENAKFGRGNSGALNWWSAYNGVTEFICHQAGRKQDNRLDSAWFGDGKAVSSRALSQAITMSGIA